APCRRPGPQAVAGDEKSQPPSRAWVGLLCCPARVPGSPCALSRESAAMSTRLASPAPERTRSWRSGLLRVAGVCGVVYLALIICLMLLENEMVYHPCTVVEGWEKPPRDLAVEDVEIQSADSTRLHAWWAVPPGWHPEQGAVLFCHGNGGNLSHRGWALKPWL